MSKSFRNAALAGFAAIALLATVPAFASETKDFSTAESRRAVLKQDMAAIKAAKASHNKEAWQAARETLKQDRMAAKQAVSASSQNRAGNGDAVGSMHQSPSAMSGTAK